MSQKRTTKLVDLEDGRHGTFVEKVYTHDDGTQIKPDPGAEADKVCKVKFYEEIDITKSPIRWVKALIGKAEPVVTKKKFPDEAVYTMTLDSTAPGKPPEVCVIEEDQFGKQNFMDKLDKKHKRQISQIQKQRKKAQGDADMQKMQDFGDKEEENKDKNYKKRSRPVDRRPMEGYGEEEIYE